MNKIKDFVMMCLSSDKNILITAIIIVFSIILIANLFGRLATASIAFAFMVIVLVLFPIILRGSYKKFKNKEKEE
jgi:Mn2+/Fe2+ NRAMP family transporter